MKTSHVENDYIEHPGLVPPTGPKLLPPLVLPRHPLRGTALPALLPVYTSCMNLAQCGYNQLHSPGFQSKHMNVICKAATGGAKGSRPDKPF
ncbi:sprouty-like protein 4 [Heterocephalus glaber]|uniref:Sprouty-like protein 4 n=1 Tax=Heterocephalus glaber TaxID=10181 RepID=G5BPW4_HETGA|nr:sprouty-like protein 4 [Heterocephalus glaber]